MYSRFKNVRQREKNTKDCVKTVLSRIHNSYVLMVRPLCCSKRTKKTWTKLPRFAEGRKTLLSDLWSLSCALFSRSSTHAHAHVHTRIHTCIHTQRHAHSVSSLSLSPAERSLLSFSYFCRLLFFRSFVFSGSARNREREGILSWSWSAVRSTG